jgi:hypothetical protein
VKLLDESDIAQVRTRRRAVSPTPERDLTVHSLNCEAGLNEQEIAGIQVSALVDDQGAPRDFILVAAETTKHLSSRKVPMGPDVRKDVIAFCRRYPQATHVAFDPETGRRMCGSRIRTWFREIYRDAGMPGFTILSGRRTYARRSKKGGE